MNRVSAPPATNSPRVNTLLRLDCATTASSARCTAGCGQLAFVITVPSQHTIRRDVLSSTSPHRRIAPPLEHQLLLQSTFDLSRNVELDWVARYVDRLPSPNVPSYLSLDLRIGWRMTQSIELSLVGQNLLEEEHQEFIPASPSARQIERSVYARLTWRP